MPLDSIEVIFRALARLKDSSFTVVDTPMFEVMAHPDPLGLFTKRAEILDGDELGGVPGTRSAGERIGGGSSRA